MATKKPSSTTTSTAPSNPDRPYVVVRTYSAGVHVGELVSRDGKEVRLANSSRIWRWRGANTLDEIALRGVAEDYTRISEQAPDKLVTEAIEVITCTEAARANLSRPRWGA